MKGGMVILSMMSHPIFSRLKKIQGFLMSNYHSFWKVLKRQKICGWKSYLDQCKCANGRLNRTQCPEICYLWFCKCCTFFVIAVPVPVAVAVIAPVGKAKLKNNKMKDFFEKFDNTIIQIIVWTFLLGDEQNVSLY